MIDFKNEYGHYPTRQDFKAKKIKPSRNTYYRIFGSMESTIKQVEMYEKGELVTEDEPGIKSVKPLSKKGEFQCPFCGNWTSDSEKYHSSLTKILIMRFINLLKSNNEKKYTDAVMDSIHAVFGANNSLLRDELGLAGYLDAFEQLHGKGKQDIEYKQKCGYCDQWKWDHLITLDNSSVARFICEGCLSKNKTEQRTRP